MSRNHQLLELSGGVWPFGRFTFVALLACVSWGQEAKKGGAVPTFGTTVVVPGGLRGAIYYIDDGTQSLPRFEKLDPVGTIYASELNIPARHWLAGFPGITTRVEWFAIDYRGRIWIETPGAYRFSLESDDGSKLYIDERQVIDNDGQHPTQMRRGKAQLRAGVHDIRVSYFQGPRDALALVLKVAAPHEGWKVFNTNDFRPPPNPDDWRNSDANTPTGMADGAARMKLRDLPAIEALDARPVRHDFEFHAAVLRFARQQRTAQIAVVLEVSPDSFSLPSQTNELARDHVLVLARIKDSAGNVSDQYSAELPLAVGGRSLSSSHPVVLPAGTYTLETAVVGPQRSSVSCNITSFSVAEQASRLGLSSIILARRVEPVDGSEQNPLVYRGSRLIPQLDTAVGPGTKPTLYFFVYPDQTSGDKLKVKIELLNNGRSIATKTGVLPPPDASGVIVMHLEAPDSPGNWEVRITVTQGIQETSDSARYVLGGR